MCLVQHPWFSPALTGMQPECCNSSTGAGISSAGSRGCRRRGALRDMLLSMKMLSVSVGPHLLLCCPRKLKVVVSSPPLSTSCLKK